jgi:uroporphyrinogen-III synthase
MRVLVTRPEPGADETAAAVRAAGHDPVLLPLLAIERTGIVPDVAGVQALLATSRNGIAAFAQSSARRDLPVLAVGDRTAQAARDHGFTDVRSAAGAAADLASLAQRTLDPARGALLHAAGEDVAEDMAAVLAPHGFSVRRAVLYRAVAAQGLDASVITACRGALFFSPRTAAIFVTLSRAAGLEKEFERIAALCLSENVARALRVLPWQAVLVADRPDQARLLSLLSRMV